jgi:hypothetical protein
MTDSDLKEKARFLKTDRLGRVRTPRDQREAILDAFEASALSRIEFAQVHGIKYQTLCYLATKAVARGLQNKASR